MNSKLQVALLLPYWLAQWLIGTFFVWLPLWLVGVFMVTIHAALGRYEYSSDRGWEGPAWWWKDKYMYLWETRDNGCCPLWYNNGFGAKRSLFLNIVLWSAFRNAVGGNPMRGGPVHNNKVKIYGCPWPSFYATNYYDETGKRKWFWRMIRCGWRVGIWGSIFVGSKEKWRVLDIQHGFKRQYYLNTEATGFSYLNFTPWDSGLRSR